MENQRSLQLFSIIISISLMIAPLPLVAIAEQIAISDLEKELMLQSPDEEYAHLGDDAQTIKEIISFIKKINPQSSSDFDELLSYLEEGFSVVPYGSLIELLHRAETIIENNQSQEFSDQKEQILDDIITLMSKAATRDLTINIDSSNHAPNNSAQANPFVVYEDLKVNGKSKLHGHLHVKKDITGHKKLKIHGNARFHSNVNIDGILSADDASIGSLLVNDLIVDDITIQGTISAQDGFFDTITVNNLTTTVSILDYVMNNITIPGTISANDAIVSHATVQTLSVSDGYFENLSVENCVPNLCATTFSTTNQSISGVLSVNDIIITDDLRITHFTTPGVLHNDGVGNISSSLIVNADVSSTAAITDTKLATISTSGKVANSATTATSSNSPNTIVARDGSGNFSAGTITANLIGNASSATTAGSVSTFSGTLAGDVTGTQNATVVASVGGQSAANIATGVALANAATSANTPNTIVLRDGSGNFSAGTITANLIGNASSATTAGSVSNFSGSLAGDVIGTQNATVVASVGGQSAANIATGVALANAATNANTANAIISRNSSGGFSAGATSITDAIISNSATILPFTTAGIIHNNASGLLSSSLIVNADITNATITNAKLATISNSNTPGNIVVRDGSGNFATNMITIAGTPTNPTDVATKAYVDTLATTGIAVKSPAVAVGTSNQILNGLTTIDGVSLAVNDYVLLSAQTNPVENGLWLAQVGGWIRPTDFATGTTADTAYVLILSGTTYQGSSWLCSTPNAVIDTDPISFALFSLPNSTNGANVGAGTGLIFDDKTGNTLNFKSLIQSNHLIITNGLDDITLATDGTNLNSPNTLVARDASGNFSANIITADLVGNASTATTAGSSLNFSGSLAGDVTGTQNATVVASVGGQSAANIAAGVVLANNATNINTANTIVLRDNSGNFSAGTITANLIGNVTGNVTGNLTGTATNNVLKTGDTMTGTLTLPAGSASIPSLQFTGSTNTGMSAPSANTLSLDINGVEKIGISASAITLGANLILSNPLCNQAIQVATPGSLGTVVANATTSVLLLKPVGILPLTVTVVFPPSPTNGQYFTVILGTNVVLTLINSGNGASISNGLTSWGLGLGNLSAASYIYYAADNTWYRCA